MLSHRRKNINCSECRKTTKGCRLWNLFAARLPCLYKRCFTPFKSSLSGHRTCSQRLTPLKSGFAWSHAIRSKGTGLQSPAPPLLKSPPALCRANSSHRLRRMLRSPEWCPTSSDVLMDFFSHYYFAVVLCALSLISTRFLSFLRMQESHSASLSKRVNFASSCGLFWV